MLMEESLEAWFKREVLSHEESLTRFLARRWRDRDELQDLKQETYARVYEAARKEKPRVPRAFLFTTAIHLLTDHFRRSSVVSFCGAKQEHLDTLIDEISPEQQLVAAIQLAEVDSGLSRLSAKCREVVWLRRVQSLSQREVAKRLGVSEKTVEKHLRIGGRRLAAWVQPSA